MTVTKDPLASGDLIADRRYAYGRAAADDGDVATAADLFAQALELAPDWPAALFALGDAEERLGRGEAAARRFRAALEADPADSLGAGLRLALLGAADAPQALPSAYVTRLFDDYAPRFEAHVVGALGYRGPALLVEALDIVAPGRRFADALDLGCGTGLMGAAIRGRVQRLDGVDIAPAMVAAARARGVYHALEARDAVAFLDRSPAARYDLILAADLFCYLGDLAPLLAACRRALAGGGLVAFTAEACEGDGFRLLKGLRFAHSPGYFETAARDAGLRRLSLSPAWARREADAEAPGLVGVYAAE